MNQETQRLLAVIAEDDSTAVADNAEAFGAELRRLSDENTRLRAALGEIHSAYARYQQVREKGWEDYGVTADELIEAIIKSKAV